MREELYYYVGIKIDYAMHNNITYYYDVFIILYEVVGLVNIGI